MPHCWLFGHSFLVEVASEDSSAFAVAAAYTSVVGNSFVEALAYAFEDDSSAAAAESLVAAELQPMEDLAWRWLGGSRQGSPRPDWVSRGTHYHPHPPAFLVVAAGEIAVTASFETVTIATVGSVVAHGYPVASEPSAGSPERVVASKVLVSPVPMGLLETCLPRWWLVERSPFAAEKAAAFVDSSAFEVADPFAAVGLAAKGLQPAVDPAWRWQELSSQGFPYPDWESRETLHHHHRQLVAGEIAVAAWNARLGYQFEAATTETV